MPDLRNVDLNLLIHLDALLGTRSVTRAARRLSLSQSAMSGSLARLRKIFNDPLMVRSGRDLTLTDHAEALIEPIREILALIDKALVEKPEYTPRTATRTFSISASDYAAAVILAPLIRALSAEAPNVTINVLPRSANVPGLLGADAADLVIEPRETMGTTAFPGRHLFADRWLCVLDGHVHEVKDEGIGSAEYLRLPHLVYSIGQEMQLNLADRHLADMGVERRIEVTIESFLMVPHLIRGTSLVSLILERTTDFLQVSGLRFVEPPIPVPEINEAMYWHPRHTDDPGHRWLRGRLAAIATELDDP